MDNLKYYMVNTEQTLPSLINSLNESYLLPERIDSIKMVLKFLRTCELSELDEVLLQFVMPALKNSLSEIFDKNASILKSTPQEEAILHELKSNIQMAISIFYICDEILVLLSELGAVQYAYVHSIPQNLSEMILSSFQHCKFSQELYAVNMNTNNEILELFRKIQEVHFKFLKWFEELLLLDDLIEDSMYMLRSVISIICVIGEVLLDMNLKSMVDNWKGFTSITQKYSCFLNQVEFDLSLPLRILKESIKAKGDDIIEMDLNNMKQIHQIMKIVNFLIRVTLKLCETFFAHIGNSCTDVLAFCFILYSYSPHYFISQYPEELTNLVKSASENRKPFLTRLLETYGSLMIPSIEEMKTFGNKFGSIELLVDIFDIIIDDCRMYDNVECCKLIQSTFEMIQISPLDLYFSQELYEDLVVNMTVIILATSEKSFPSIETILLTNILQDQFWPAVLALDVWCSVMGNSSLAACLESITYMLQQTSKLNSVTFTKRVEFVNFKTLLWRLHQLVPTARTSDMLTKFKPQENYFWQSVGLQNITPAQRGLLEPLFTDIYQLHDRIPNLPPCDFIRLMETLDTVSTLHFNSFGLHATRICQIIVDLWNFTLPSPTSTANNFFKYFFSKLCSISRAFLQHFDGTTLVIVLNHLKQVFISTEYKVLIIEQLNTLSSRSVENSLDKNTILAEMAGLLELLLQDSHPVIRQMALKECHSFIENSPHDQITNSVIRNLRNTKYDVNPFLQKTPLAAPSCEQKYFQMLEEFSFEHKCSVWTESVISSTEQSVLTTYMVKPPSEIPGRQRKEMSINNHKNKKLKVNVEPTESNLCEIDSLISSIKSDMKTLAKAVKKESLTTKNVSDINYIITQLSSIAQK